MANRPPSSLGARCRGADGRARGAGGIGRGGSRTPQGQRQDRDRPPRAIGALLLPRREPEPECGSTTHNAERRRQEALTIPHYIAGYVAGARDPVRADRDIAELKHFSGRRLVSTQGTTPLKAAEQAHRESRLGIAILQAPDHARAIEMVEKGEADGFAMDDEMRRMIGGTREAYAIFDRWFMRPIPPRFLVFEPADESPAQRLLEVPE